MSVTLSILTSLAVCALAAALEGLLAGRRVKSFLASLRMPTYSPSLLTWSLIGTGYYAICFTLLYRLLRSPYFALERCALILLGVVMTLNALWNYTFFRMGNLRLSFVLSLLYGIVSLALIVCLMLIDAIGALVFLPYLLYLAYAYTWSYRLLTLNPL